MSAVAKFEVIQLQFSDRTENFVGKTENAGNQHFFPTRFSNVLFAGGRKNQGTLGKD